MIREGPRFDRSFPIRHTARVAKLKPEPRVVSIPADYHPEDLERPIAVDWDGFTVVVRFREVSGRLEVWSLEITTIPWPGRQPRRVRAAALRFPWAEIIRKAAEWHLLEVHSAALRPLDEADLEAMNPHRREAKALGFNLEPTPKATRDQRRTIEAARRKLPAAVASFTEMNRGRPQLHDPHVVAELYREAYAAGLPPTKTVADRLGITYSAAGKQVERARKSGELEPAPRPGVPGLAKPKRRKNRGKR